MYAHLIKVSQAYLGKNRISNLGGYHSIIYPLFERTRDESELNASIPSGFSWVEVSEQPLHKTFLAISDRPAITTDAKAIQIDSKMISDDFLSAPFYEFTVTVNPTYAKKITDTSSKRVAAKNKEEVIDWVHRREAQWGMKIHNLEVLDLNVHRFKKKNKDQVTLVTSKLKGRLQVMDRELFIKAFKNGVGRGRSYGCGLLQVIPVSI